MGKKKNKQRRRGVVMGADEEEGRGFFRGRGSRRVYHCGGYTVPAAKVWTSDLEIVDSNCKKFKNDKVPKLVITQDPHGAVVKMFHFLARAEEEFGKDEVGFYLMGDMSRKDIWIIDDIYVPVQTPSPAKVINFPPIVSVERRPIIGVAHILNTVGGERHRSLQDEDTVEGNHPISLVFGSGFKMKANLRVKLKCGALTIVGVDPVIDFGGEHGEFVESAIERIVKYNENKARTSQSTGYSYGCGRSVHDNDPDKVRENQTSIQLKDNVSDEQYAAYLKQRGFSPAEIQEAMDWIGSDTTVVVHDEQGIAIVGVKSRGEVATEIASRKGSSASKGQPWSIEDDTKGNSGKDDEKPEEKKEEKEEEKKDDKKEEPVGKKG